MMHFCVHAGVDLSSNISGVARNPLLSLEVFVILWSTALKKYLPDTVSRNKFHMLQLFAEKEFDNSEMYIL